MKKYEEYAEYIPEEIRISIASLNNQVRQAILVLLNNRGELSFADIQKELNLDKIKLNFHLKNLFSSALIDHYYKHEVGNQKYSYYSVSQLGKRVLTSLIQAFIPPSPIVQDVTPLERYQEYRMDGLRAYNIGDVLFCSSKKGEKKCMPVTSYSLSEANSFDVKGSSRVSCSVSKYAKMT